MSIGHPIYINLHHNGNKNFILTDIRGMCSAVREVPSLTGVGEHDEPFSINDL